MPFNLSSSETRIALGTFRSNTHNYHVVRILSTILFPCCKVHCNALLHKRYINANKNKMIPTLWTTVKCQHHQQITFLVLTVASNLQKKATT